MASDRPCALRNSRSLGVNAGWAESLAFHPSGQILVSAGTDGTTRLIDVAARVILGAPLPVIDNVHEDATFTPDGNRAIVISARREGFLWDVTLDGWKEQACAVAARTSPAISGTSFSPSVPSSGCVRTHRAASCPCSFVQGILC